MTNINNKKRRWLPIIMAALCATAFAQTKSTPEYLASAGFSQVNDSTWTIAGRATVIMSGNHVKAFEATQNHDWTMTFGNGSRQGAVVNVKSGEKIVFADGRLKFANGISYHPASNDVQILFKRSILRSAIFNEARDALFATDIKPVNASQESLGKYYPANSSSGYTLDAYGNFNAKVEADNDQKQSALQAKRNANNNKLQNIISQSESNTYEAMYKKYGRRVVDGLMNGEIVVGAPIDLVKNMLASKKNGYDFSYQSKVVASNAVTETREFSPEVFTPHSYHVHYYVTYNKKTGRVTSYSIRRPKPYY